MYHLLESSFFSAEFDLSRLSCIFNSCNNTVKEANDLFVKKKKYKLNMLVMILVNAT